MRVPAILAVTAAAALPLAGCAVGQPTSSSGNNFTGPAKDVAATIDSLSTAASKDDSKAICTSLLSKGLAAQLSSPSRSCETAIDGQLKAADVLDLKVRSIQVNGAQATARVTSTESGHVRTQTLRLVRQRGTWRIAGLA